MTYWNDSHDDPGRQEHGFDSFAYDATSRSASARHLTVLDILVLAGFACVAFLAFDDFASAGNAAGHYPATETPQRQQVCSDEELRNMHGARDVCFDTPMPPDHKVSSEANPIGFQGS
jgi:hypothetical protein